MTSRLSWRPRRSAGAARDLLHAVVRYGNNFDIDGAGWSESQVTAYCTTRGVDFERAVREARDPARALPFKNLLGSTWIVTDGKVGAYNALTGETENEVEGPGSLTLHAYWATFENAVAARDRCVEQNSAAPLSEMLTSGVSSVESYLRHRAKIWNDSGGSPPLVDDGSNKVPFDDKLRTWVRITSGTNGVDLGSRRWQEFRQLRDLRDDVVVHGKSTSVGWSYRDVAKVLNLFRSLAAGLLDLHVLHGEKCPAVILRAVYAPHVEVESAAAS